LDALPFSSSSSTHAGFSGPPMVVAKTHHPPPDQAPGIPHMIPEECSAENNSITVAWAPHHTSCVSGFTLELDDGSNGAFREVYTGEETVCTIDGLHFNSIYKARVRAYNSTGNSSFCEPLCLQTAE
ncbi:unnamed protein product, partial [Meganyctiphanes norvegica]